MSTPVDIHIAPVEPALISQCQLVHQEIPRSRVKEIRHVVFEGEKRWSDHPGGSPFQRWYREMAMGPDAFRMTDKKRGERGVQGRLISWKTGKSFAPENLFFKTLDTAKLLPMNLAVFKIQMYADASAWTIMENSKDTKEGSINLLLFGIMHELLLLRSLRDRGGGDIPVIIVGWTENEISLAMDYWVGLSKGEWSEDERNAKYARVEASFCLRLRPCFSQVDLLVRSLYQDPEVGYVPPFIVFHPILTDSRASALFTTPENCPPQEMLASWPKSCNGPGCPNAVCGAFRFENCRSLVKGSKMVRQSVWPTGLVMCNLWICQAKYEPGKEDSVVLQRCQKCKEALYCCVSHQKLDWPDHKLVCETRS